jgi:hypothetical protein
MTGVPFSCASFINSLMYAKSTLMMLLVLAACGDSEEGTQQETDEGIFFKTKQNLFNLFSFCLC